MTRRSRPELAALLFGLSAAMCALLGVTTDRWWLPLAVLNAGLALYCLRRHQLAGASDGP